MAKGDTQVMTPAERRTVVRLRVLLLWGVPLLVVLAGAIVWLLSGRYVSTDDSYVKADKVMVSADVSGKIDSIAVTENQPVRKGDLLFQIDPAPYRITVAKDEAQLLTVKGQVLALQASYLAKSREIELAKTNLVFAGHEYARMEKLSGQGFVPRIKLDSLRHDADAARDNLAMLEAERLQIQAQIGTDVHISPEKHARYLNALAEVERAKLDLQRTEVRAPFDGIASQVPKPGQFVSPGVAVMSVVGSTRLWVDANFKETDIEHMHPGQPVEVEFDSYPGMKWKGTLDSLAQASGAEFAILPPQNASGNWVKIAQRFPIRINVKTDKQHPLRAGMSADVEVDTGVYRHMPRWLRHLYSRP